MQRVLCRLAVTVLGVVAVALLPSASRAQGGCDLCQDVEWNGEWAHKFNGPGALFSCSGTSGGCHEGLMWELCTDLHSGCSVTTYDAAGKAAREIEDALQRGDTKALDALMKKYRGNLVANVARQSLDIRTCNGILVARVADPKRHVRILRA